MPGSGSADWCAFAVETQDITNEQFFHVLRLAIRVNSPPRTTRAYGDVFQKRMSLLTDRKRDLAEILSNFASHLVVEPALSLSQCPDDVFCVCANIVRLERTQIALELLLRLGKDYNLSLSVRSTMGGRNANEQSYR